MLGQFQTARMFGKLQLLRTDLDAHGALTGAVHGAVSTNTASTMVVRDANGRFQATDPSAAQDVATKAWVEAGAAGGGTVTSVDSGTGLTGGPITTIGTLALANTAVTPGAYTNADITIDAQGRITAAANGSGVGTNLGESYSATGVTVTSSTGSNVTLNGATTSLAGIFVAADKTRLDNMADNANNYSHPNHTGHVTSTGDGATVLVIAAITGQAATTSIASTDELLINDGGLLRRVDISVLDSYFDGKIIPATHSHTGTTISNLAAADTTSGTFDIARIPTGTTGATVAIGNHTHTAVNDVSGLAVNIDGITAITADGASFEVLMWNGSANRSIRMDDIKNVKGVDGQRCFIQSATPTAEATDDLWFDTS